MSRFKTGQERERKKEIRKEQKKLAKAGQRQLYAAEVAAKKSKLAKRETDGQV